jgi:hypothetical protein
LRYLFLTGETAGDSLSAVSQFSSLRKLELHGFADLFDLRDLRVAPSLENLTLSGFDRLGSLSGIERMENLRALELFACSKLSDIQPLAAMGSLEKIGLGTLLANSTDLTPLAALPRLSEIALMGHNSFDLTALRGRPDLVVRIPAGSHLKEADGLGPRSGVAEFTSPPRMYIPAAEEA